MSFGLSNAPATFMCCMIYIFSNIVGNTIEVFINDYCVVGDSFDQFLNNFVEVLKRCEYYNLVLN